MVTNFVMVAAVPFDTAQLKDCVRRNSVSKETEAEKNGLKERESIISSRSRRRRRNLTPAERLSLRRERNKTSAQASRTKAKLQEDLLKQQLFYLEYETMKLLLENEALRKQSNNLEAENKILKLKAQSVYSGSMDKGSDEEATFKHAWFVNVPRQKEWVLPRILFILIILMREAMKNTIILNYWVMYINKQLSLNSLKYLQNLKHLPLILMIPHAGYLYSTKIPNG